MPSPRGEGEDAGWGAEAEVTEREREAGAYFRRVRKEPSREIECYSHFLGSIMP